MAKTKLKLTARKKMLTGSIFAALIILVGIFAWAQLKSDVPEVIEEEPEFSRVASDIQVTATIHLNDGDADGGLRYYDEQIELRTDDKEKKALLVLKSGFAITAERYDLAIDLAREADNMGSDVTTVRALAQAYAAGGDKGEALIHYKKLLEIRQAEEGETNPNKLAEGRESTLGSIIRELEQ